MLLYQVFAIWTFGELMVFQFQRPSSFKMPVRHCEEEVVQIDWMVTLSTASPLCKWYKSTDLFNYDCSLLVIGLADYYYYS